MGKIVSVASKLRRDRARRLRRDQTEAETRLWEALRAGRLDGWKWRRQASVGPFIVDFLCLEAAIAVELDGGIHAEQAIYDARRDAYLKRKGLQVLRFWNSEVFADPERVRWMILSACRESDPSRRGHRIERHRRTANQTLRGPSGPTAGMSHAQRRPLPTSPTALRAWERGVNVRNRPRLCKNAKQFRLLTSRCRRRGYEPLRRG